MVRRLSHSLHHEPQGSQVPRHNPHSPQCFPTSWKMTLSFSSSWLSSLSPSWPLFPELKSFLAWFVYLVAGTDVWMEGSAIRPYMKFIRDVLNATNTHTTNVYTWEELWIPRWQHKWCLTKVYNNKWQSCVEIESYSVVYFHCIAAFEALYHWTPIKGGAHVHFVDSLDIHTSMKHVWALPLTEVQRYGTSNTATQSKYATE